MRPPLPPPDLTTPPPLEGPPVTRAQAAAAALATLRDPEAGPEDRARAHAEVVAWIYHQHYAPALDARLARRLAGAGLIAPEAPGEVFTRFCLRLSSRPELLGQRDLPTRSWLWRALQRESRELERSQRRTQRGRLAPGEGAEASIAASTLPASRQGDPRDRFLGSPETAALLGELAGVLARELARLELEAPRQHLAWSLRERGESYRDISRELAASEGTVKSWIHRARRTLEARMSAYLEDADA